jgi:hypothetical protein
LLSVKAGDFGRAARELATRVLLFTTFPVNPDKLTVAPLEYFHTYRLFRTIDELA